MQDRIIETNPRLPQDIWIEILRQTQSLLSCLRLGNYSAAQEFVTLYQKNSLLDNPNQDIENEKKQAILEAVVEDNKEKVHFLVDCQLAVPDLDIAAEHQRWSMLCWMKTAFPELSICTAKSFIEMMKLGNLRGYEWLLRHCPGAVDDSVMAYAVQTGRNDIVDLMCKNGFPAKWDNLAEANIEHHREIEMNLAEHTLLQDVPFSKKGGCLWHDDVKGF